MAADESEAEVDLDRLWHDRHRLGAVLTEQVDRLDPSPVTDVSCSTSGTTVAGWVTWR